MTTGQVQQNSKRIGLIGGGVRLRAVLRHMQPFGGFVVSAICDPEESAVDAARALYGASLRHFVSEDEFFQAADMDWVFVGSPNHLHARHAIKALMAGKDVFCEKPLATELADCLAIRQAQSISGRSFAFGLVLRCSPFYATIKKLIDEGEIGRILSFEFNETVDFDHGGRRIFSTWRRNFADAGSHLLEKCCHDLDIANWLVGSLPVEVASFGGLDFFKPENAHHADRLGLAPDGRKAYSPAEGTPGAVPPFSEGATIIDNQVAILQYANGVRATFHTNCNAAMRERRFYFCGTEGSLIADAYTGIIEWQRTGYRTEMQRLDMQIEGGQGHAGGDSVMAARLIAAMQDGQHEMATVEDGIRACVVAFGLDQALAERRVVDLRSIWERCGINPDDAITKASPLLQC